MGRPSAPTQETPEWTNLAFRGWSQDSFYTRKVHLEGGRNGVRGSRGKDNAFGGLSNSAVKKIAKPIFYHQTQLDDVALWWSIAASYFGWAADPSQFLDTPQSRQFTVHEFVRIQWQLHNSPLPEQSTYAIPTPQLIERVSHALEQLKKLSEAALRENNIPLGKSLSRANSERPLFAGGLHEFRPSNGQIEQRHGYGVAVLPTVDPASEMDVDHDPVASTSPAPIPFNPEAKARPSPVHTRASPTAQDPIPLVDSSPVENIAPQDTSDPPSAGQSKKRRGGAGRTKSKTKLRVKMEQNPEKLRQSARINVTSRLKLGVEGGKHLASPTTLTPPPTRKRKGKDHDRITPGPDNAADDTSEAPPEKPAVDSLERPISNTPATVRRKRGRPKKTLILDPIVVSSPPESNEIQESSTFSKRRTRSSSSVHQGAVSISDHASQHASADSLPPRKRRKSGQQLQGVFPDDSTPSSPNSSRCAEVPRSPDPSQAKLVPNGLLTPTSMAAASPVSPASPAPTAERDGCIDVPPTPAGDVRRKRAPPLEYPDPTGATGVQVDTQIGRDVGIGTAGKPRRGAALIADKRIEHHVELRKRYEQGRAQPQVDTPRSPLISPPHSPPPPTKPEQCALMKCSTPVASDDASLDVLASLAMEHTASNLMIYGDAPVGHLLPRGPPSPPATIMDLDSPYCSPDKRITEFSAPLESMLTPQTPLYRLSAVRTDACREVIDDCEREGDSIHPRPYLPPFQTQNTEGIDMTCPPGTIHRDIIEPFELDIQFPPATSKVIRRPVAYPKQQPKPENRPLVKGFPRIWAETRAEICETLDYFRTYQAGVCVENQTAVGYLLDGFPGPRDYCSPDARVIISHGGGGSGVERLPDGRTITGMIADHDLNKGSPAALKNAFEKKRAVVLLAGSRYRGFPIRFEEKCRYFVLGYYAITHVWCYPEGDVVTGTSHKTGLRIPGQATRSMFRFQWLPDTPGSKPWWYNLDSQSIFADGNAYRDVASSLLPPHICRVCFRKSPIVFQERLCLRPDCLNFRKERFSEVQYHPSFLVETTIGGYVKQHERLVPSLAMSVLLSHQLEHSTTRSAWTGWHCSVCGKITSRTFWDRWHCSHCGKTDTEFLALHALQPAPSGNEWDKIPKLPNSVTCDEKSIYDLRVRTYMLPGQSLVYHVQGLSPLTVNSIFEAYQKGSAGSLFKRASTNSNMVNGTKNRHFSFNSGVPYQYSSKNDTTSFEHGPTCVVQARDIVSHVVQTALDRPSNLVNFNEVLSVAYMEDMAMGYHSDDEPGLQHIVASLSMGATCKMQFRARQKPAKGVEFRDVEAFQSLGHKCILTLKLVHGDVVIMAGNMQLLYEHCIQRLTGFRIAATCRTIDQQTHNRSSSSSK